MALTKKDLGKNDWGLSLADLKAAKKQAPLIRRLLPTVRSEEEYQVAVKILDGLMGEVRGDEHHDLAPYLHILGTLISEYEKQHLVIPQVCPIEVLRYLMTEHELTQSDLPEIGNQAKVSEILSGKRKLNTRQIQALSQRFGLSPAAFFEG